MSEIPTSLRLPKDFLDRADALIEVLDRDPELRVYGPWSRSRVLRLVIREGLEAVEARSSSR